MSGNTAKTTFLWTIGNFNELPGGNNDLFFSSDFSVAGPDNKITKWCLELFPNKDDVVAVYLLSLDNNDFDVKASGSFSIVDSSWKEQETTSFDNFSFSSSWRGDLIQLGKLRQNSSTLLPNGKLQIRCKLEVFGQAGSKESFNKTQINDECQRQVINHYENLFARKNLADLEITCDGELFNCHRNILSARSPVFSAMFQVDMIENQSKKVDIPDVKKEVFSELLKFIYTGSISSEDSLKKQAKDILAAANKYQLDLLKKLCEAQLVSTLNASNCFDLLVLGDFHEAEKLKMVAMDFVSINSASLIETDVYEDFFRTQHSDLVLEVTKAMVPKKD